jgi:rhamnose utilization protein RhaD (predicted bifunctional aldolase and dehydrogenase)
MNTKSKEQMKGISAYVGSRRDYVQGGGGNTSVKFDDRIMAIKASGYTLAEVTAEKGYVLVDYQKIKQYYNSVDVKEQKDYEKESLEINLKSVLPLEGMEQMRPSVEVGFHSFLDKCVIHTHSVYANVLCCSSEGREIAQEIFKGSGLKYLYISYIDPGFSLTLAVRQALQAFKIQYGSVPEVIFLENHGMIVHSDHEKAAMEMNDLVNNRIREYFNLGNFPSPEIKKTQNSYLNDSDYLKKFIIKYNAGEAYFNRLKLYPDQLVYIGNKMGDRIKINSKTGDINYFTGEKEAQAIEETLLGVAYVIDSVQNAGLTLKQMDENGAAFINNWESEKYRSQLIK